MIAAALGALVQIAVPSIYDIEIWDTHKIAIEKRVDVGGVYGLRDFYWRIVLGSDVQDICSSVSMTATLEKISVTNENIWKDATSKLPDLVFRYSASGDGLHCKGLGGENSLPKLQILEVERNNESINEETKFVANADTFVAQKYHCGDLAADRRGFAVVYTLDRDLHIDISPSDNELPSSCYVYRDPRPLLGNKKLSAEFVGFFGGGGGIVGGLGGGSGVLHSLLHVSQLPEEHDGLDGGDNGQDERERNEPPRQFIEPPFGRRAVIGVVAYFVGFAVMFSAARRYDVDDIRAWRRIALGALVMVAGFIYMGLNFDPRTWGWPI